MRSHSRSEPCLSAITVAELRFGADNRQSRKIHQAIDAFLAGVRVLAFDAAAAATFGKVATALSSGGVPIGQLDTLIASHSQVVIPMVDPCRGYDASSYPEREGGRR